MGSVSPLGNGTEGPARWSLRLFGGFELSVLPGGERVAPPGKRERVLLAYLALSPKARQPRRKLATLLWGDAADETTIDNLRNCLWNLRKALGDTEHRVVASDGEDIVLDVTAFDVDALAFRLLATQSGRTELEEAAKLYSGEFLDGLVIESEEFESWRRAEASRYRDQAIDVLTRLMTRYSECGETERAIEAGERILRLEPLHEAAVRRLMRHYAESGRRGAAIQLYRTFAAALRTELDAQPEAETRLVFAEIVRGGEERTSPSAATDPKLPPRSTGGMARPSDAPGVQRLPTRPTFGLRTPLALLAGVLIVATALISYRQFASLGTSAESRPAVVTEEAVPALRTSTISIAVLPFANMSGDASQEFFSDGMTEEITAALAKVPNLRVIARTSAFQFKGQNQDIRMVGQALGTTHLIEGSVRKVGDRVRITAQLIKVDDGTHLWTENYDRELTDIFAIQEDISTAIAGALRMPLGLAPSERLVSSRSIDPESYQQYLRAKPLVRARAAGVPDAIKILEPLVARHPDYAPAWALLGMAYALTPNFRSHTISVDEARRIANTYYPKAEAAARRAIQLDANLADGYVALGSTHGGRGKWLLAEELFSKALTLDPNNPDALNAYSVGLSQVGRLDDAIMMKRQLRALEPTDPGSSLNLGEVLWTKGQNDAATAVLKDVPRDYANRARALAMIYASMGRYGEAADVLLEFPPRAVPPERAAEAAALLRTAPAKTISPQNLPRLGFLGFIYLYVGAPERALEFYEDRAAAGVFGNGDATFLWNPSYAPVRKMERFKTFARRAGLVEYWRARGWPEFCRPMADDDFVCV